MRLFERGARVLTLTQEGRALAERAGALLTELDETAAAIAAGGGRARGRLRISAPLLFSQVAMGKVAAGFALKYPEVRLAVTTEDRAVDMVEEGVDIAIRIGRLADTSFMARKIGEDKRLICASPAYLARYGTPRTPQDLVRHRCIVSRERAYLNRWAFKAGSDVQEIEVTGPLAVSEGEAQLQMALQGVGIVRLTRLTVAQAVRDGKLLSLFEAQSADSGVPIHAVYPHRRHLPSKVPAFVDFLIEKFTPPPWEI